MRCNPRNGLVSAHRTVPSDHWDERDMGINRPVDSWAQFFKCTFLWDFDFFDFFCGVGLLSPSSCCSLVDSVLDRSESSLSLSERLRESSRLPIKHLKKIFLISVLRKISGPFDPSLFIGNYEIDKKNHRNYLKNYRFWIISERNIMKKKFPI